MEDTRITFETAKLAKKKDLLKILIKYRIHIDMNLPIIQVVY